MRRPLRVSIVSLVVILAASCGVARVTETGPGSGGPGAGSGASTPGSTGSGGFTLPDPMTVRPPGATDAAPVQCAAEAHRAEIVPLDLMLLVDTSSSMTALAGTRSKWETAQSALRSFVSDPRSAGLGIGLQFFPLERLCTRDSDCYFLGIIPGTATCSGKQVCAGPNGPAPMAPTCEPPPLLVIGPSPDTCPMGTSCQTLGTCTTSGADCTNAGQACPMGGGICEVPVRTCNNGPGTTECQDSRYELPAVTIQSLPTGQGALTRALDRKTPIGDTPLGPAVRGVLNHLRTRLQADPGRKVALILASDGLPRACQRNDIPSIASDLAAAFMGPPSIPTYVIGVFSQDELMMAKLQLDRLAMGGGTNQAFVLTAADDLNMRLLEALDQIRGAALACDYRIPVAQTQNLDFGKVNVRYTSAAGPESIPYVERMERCDPMRGGWYYDVHPGMGSPARVLVCPATCNRFKTDQSAQVELVFGCATGAID